MADLTPVDRVKQALASGNRFRRDDVAELLAEVNRLRTLTDPDITYRDLEAKFQDGTFDLRAVLDPEGGQPATRFLAAVMLHAALGEGQIEEPPNYCSTEFTFKPAGSFDIDAIRCCLEVIRPGGRSSHEIRRELEAKLAAAGISQEAIDGP